MSDRTAHIQIRVTPEFKARVKAFADSRGLSTTDVLERGAELFMTGEHRCDLADGLAELLREHRERQIMNKVDVQQGLLKALQALHELQLDQDAKQILSRLKLLTKASRGLRRETIQDRHAILESIEKFEREARDDAVSTALRTACRVARVLIVAEDARDEAHERGVPGHEGIPKIPTQDSVPDLLADLRRDVEAATS